MRVVASMTVFIALAAPVAAVAQTSTRSTSKTAPASTKSGSAAPATMEREQVMAVIRPHFNKVRGCYESLLSRHPDASGTAHLTMNVAAATGKVRQATVRLDGLPDDKIFEGCMTGEAVTWIFPKSDGSEVTINYPFIFSPL